ncbi:hypothetical protein [Acetobacter estunensis]|uniref:hypothetical protein n=1 Tax=Acetobacter estunensis TaxID=104097 RepID=UPI001C2DC71E|nr:hypothetical protein [Acetobacter estunensis]MBV1838064.1 hypothetical protein [Acetobacter estunensis]
MGHNYAKPATLAQRFERVMSRLPEQWAVKIERAEGSGTWRALVHAPGVEGRWAEGDPDAVTALENAWRLNRPPAG